MSTDLLPADPTAAAPVDRNPVVHGDGIPSWFDDEHPRRRRRRWLAKLKRPAAVIAMLASAGVLWLAGWQALAISVFGVVTLVIGFVTGVAALRRVLSGSHPIVGVARAIVEEAIGTPLSILLVMLVLVSLPILPLLLDPSERLAYRVQFFLSWSLSGASVFLSLVTISLCCGSVCGDIDSRRIHMTLSKPVRRWEYLFGKWFGVVTFGALLVCLIGSGVYAFTIALAQLPAIDSADRLAVDEQVLASRAVARPIHPRQAEFIQSVEATIKNIRRDDPENFSKDPARARRRIQSQHIHEWHTVVPDMVASFLFTGIDKELTRSPVVHLQLQPFADNSSISAAEVRFALWLNDRPFPVRNGIHEPFTLPVATVHTIELPTTAIDESGSLRLTIANRNLVMPGEFSPTSISFTPGKGLQVLYRVESFSINLLKGLIIVWAKLAMLAAVAIAVAAWLGFPVALLASSMTYAAAVASSFFADSMDIYTGIDRQSDSIVAMIRLRSMMFMERLTTWQWWEAIKTVGAMFAEAFLALVPSFSRYDVIAPLATGRVIYLAEVCVAVGILGIAYPFTLLLLGWFLLEYRDLVRTSS